jgi:hypothetical protein
MIGDLPIRVTLLDTLDELALVLPSSTPIAEVKCLALARSGIKRPASEYVVKYKGAELYEGGKTLADAGVVPDGALIVLLRRRIPVR